MRAGLSIRRGRLIVCAVCLCAITHGVISQGLPGNGQSVRAATDAALTRYFEGMRQRYLFTLAEGYCLDRLSRPETLSSAQQAQLTIELSRTFVAHAQFSSGDEQADLWKRAESVVAGFREQHPSNELRWFLELQMASVPAAHGEFLSWQAELFPHDSRLQNQVLGLLQSSTSQFKSLLRNLDRNSGRSSGLSGAELREFKADLQMQLATALISEAKIAQLGDSSQAGHASILEAESVLRTLARGEDFDPRTWRSRLQLVVCARLKNELNQAADMLATLEEKQPPPQFSNEILAEEIRLLLAIKRPTDAVSMLAKERAELQKKQQSLSGELQYLYVNSLIALWEIAEFRNQTTLADDLWKEVSRNVERAEQEQGGYWGYRCRLKLSNAKEIHEYGSEVAEQLRQGRAAFAGGKLEEASLKFAIASATAGRQQKPDIAMKLGYTAASIELQSRKFEEAAQQFHQLSQQYPNSEQAADAHLLWAYCLGQYYEELRTTSRRLEYARALVEHREQFANTTSGYEATWMLGQLQESRLQRSKALPLYRVIPLEHRRGQLAQVAIARCHEGIIQTVRDQDQPTDYYVTLAQRELEAFVVNYPATPMPLSLPQAEVCLRLSRILMNAPAPGYRQADRLLERLFDSWALIQRQPDFVATDHQQTWTPLMFAATQLRIVSLAGQREFLEAQRLVATISQSSIADILKVLDGLVQAAMHTDEITRRELGQLQLKASESLNQRRNELSKSEALWLDRSLAQAYVATRQPQKAIAVYQTLLKQSPNDKKLKQTVAELLVECGSFECLTEARGLWHSLESGYQPGSVPWLHARYHVALCAYELKDLPTAKKLVKVTMLLYPKLGNETLKQQFTELKGKLDPPNG